MTQTHDVVVVGAGLAGLVTTLGTAVSLVAVLVGSGSGGDGGAAAAWARGSDHVAQVRSLIGGDKVWLEEVLDGGTTLTLGEPVPVLELDADAYPAYDLRTGTLAAAPPDVRAVLTPTSAYAARVAVDGAPRDAVAWLDTSGGEVLLTGVDEVRFLDEVTDLPAAGVTPMNGGLMSYADGTFTTLDERAAYDVPSGSADGAELITALARRAAEEAAIERIAGPIAGGRPSLLAPDPAEEAAWQAEVKRGMALDEPTAGGPGASAWTTGIGLVLAALVVPSMLWLVAARRRASRRASSTA